MSKELEKVKEMIYKRFYSKNKYLLMFIILNNSYLSKDEKEFRFKEYCLYKELMEYKNSSIIMILGLILIIALFIYFGILTFKIPEIFSI